MHKLNCSVQKYGWGRIGSESSVAVFKAAMDNEFTIDPEQRYAELWMGTHPRGPSKLCNSSGDSLDLSNHLSSRGDSAIGSSISSHFYTDNLMKSGDLPFLFKVLSISKALSIQAHPNKTLAKQLHSSDPGNYPDANHKPEMLIAISDTFEAMCGFRPAGEIADHFERYTELRELCEEANCAEFKVDSKVEELEAVLARCLRSLMSRTEEFVTERFERLRSRLSERAEGDLEKLFLRLAGQYPGDVGCFVVFLLNCFELKKGEAINLEANVPHAYLFGEGVECMACSDNVVRAGLTPKFKDVETLCSMLDYTMRSANENKLTPIRTAFSQDKPYLAEFRPTVDEFSIQQIKITNDHLNIGSSANKFLLPKSESGSILIVVEQNCEAKFETDSANGLESCAGLVYFIDANTDVEFVVGAGMKADTGDSVVLAYRAYCDIKA